MDINESFHTSNMERKMSSMACTIFNELRLEGKLCDVIIKVSGVEFNAHKNILCGCSPYFRALFTSSWNNSEKKFYDIPGVSSDMMKLILEYAYTRRVPINPDNVENLFIAADYFNILGLVQICSEFLVNQLCPQNSIGIYKFTEYYYCPELHQKAYMYILHNFENIMKTSDEFLELSAMELKGLIEKDELNIKQEEAAFEAIVKWINHNPANRKQYISVLLQEVRFALIHIDYFNNNVKVNNYVRDNKECKPIIINAFKAMYDLNINGHSNADFKNPMSRPRLPYEILFAVGGWSGGSPTNAIECYDARADQWLDITSEEESPRAYHGTAYLNGYVYIIGGFDSVDYFNNVKCFNPVKKTWQQVAPMHSKRCYVSVTILDENIYAMGGFDGHFRLNTAERYEPETNQWSLIAPMNERRSDSSATTLNDKIYICGGFNGTECLFTAEMYNLDTKQWSIISSMRSRRSGVGVMAYGEKVYVVGGFDGANRLRSAEAYNPGNNTWRVVPAMYTPRSNFGIEVVDDLLFVVGGFNGFTTTFNVECYDDKTNEWYDVHDMNIYRSALSCCVVSCLTNIRDYAARRDILYRDEVKASSSTSSLPT
ncbi:kelch-like protein 10 isoform X1 [Rhinoderma darwinii]|uniref:kelch-like protein 10 isoform X1 n=1 Tax=Rhinoderma darwinii TaxID=43563 RepID=UPI003F67F087